MAGAAWRPAVEQRVFGVVGDLGETGSVVDSGDCQKPIYAIGVREIPTALGKEATELQSVKRE